MIVKKIISILLIISILAISLNISMTDSYATEDLITKPIHILEVQPNTDYELNEESLENLYGSDVTLTQMPITLFNSQRDDLNGKYDILYFGSKSESYTALIKDNPNKNKGEYENTIDFKPGNRITNFNNDYNRGEVIPGKDITHLRSQKVIDFIETNQLVIFNNKVLNNSEKTKMFSDFKDYKSRQNVKYTNNINKKMDSYLQEFKINQYNVKPTLNIISAPEDYNKDGVAYYQTKAQNRWLVYNFSIEDYSNLHEYQAQLYLDTNGDGLFKDEELFVKKSVTNPESINIDYMLPTDYIGMLQWKLEIVDESTSVKAYEIGYTAFKSEEIDSEIVIDVLQIIPDKRNNLLDLKTLNNVNQQNLLFEQGLYDINIETITATEFNTNTPELNGVYDMIIIGFCDEVSRGVQLTSDTAINGIRDFIATGQSLMITHDMFHFYIGDAESTLYNSYGNTYSQTIKNYMVFTKEFRDEMGQNIYEKDYLKDNQVSNQTWRESYPVKGNQEYNALGVTRGLITRYNGGGTWLKSSRAHKINDGSITMFPFILPTNLQIASTHTQYFMADLENEDLIVWYTLLDNYDEYDARNNYYVYSLGNVTYSGTGHSSPKNKIQENKLFVNTMLKASWSANHAPGIQASGISNGKEYTKTQDEIIFDVRITDLDLIDKQSKLRIFIDKNKNGTYEDDEIVYPYEAEYELVNNDQVYEIITNKIPFNDLDSFDLKIVAEDSRGAIGFKEFSGIKNIDDTRLIFSNVGWKDEDILRHDTGKLEIQFDTKDITNSNFEEIELKVSTSKKKFEASVGENIAISGWSGPFEEDNNDILYYTKSITDINKKYTFDVTFSNKVETGIAFDVDLSYKKSYGAKFNDSSNNHSIRVHPPIVNFKIVDTNGKPMGVQSFDIGNTTYQTEPTGSLPVSDLPGTGNYTLSYSFNEYFYEKAEVIVTDKKKNESRFESLEDTNFVEANIDMSFSSSPIEVEIQLTYSDNLKLDYTGNVAVTTKKNSDGNLEVVNNQLFDTYITMEMPIDINSVRFKMDIGDLDISVSNEIKVYKDDAEITNSFAVTESDGSIDITTSERLTQGNYKVKIPILFEDGTILNAAEISQIVLSEAHLTQIDHTDELKIYINKGIPIKIIILNDNIDDGGNNPGGDNPDPTDNHCKISYSNKPFGVFEYSGNGTFELLIKSAKDYDMSGIIIKIGIKASEDSVTDELMSLFDKSVVDNGNIKYKIENNLLYIDELNAGDEIITIPIRAHVENTAFNSNIEYEIFIEQINQQGVGDETTEYKDINILEALKLQ